MAGPLLAASMALPAMVTGLHIPWAISEPHLDPEGVLTEEPEPWPPGIVPAVRLWDTRTTWADLEPADDSWHFDRLDAQVDAAHRHGTTDILLVLGAPPAWAARDASPGQAPWLAPGAASPPADLREWRDYVATVAKRYRGEITAYQVGNEPNLDWFWRGTTQDLHDIVRIAATTVHAVDPRAQVVAPGPLVTTAASVPVAAKWWRAMEGTGVDALALQWYPPRGTPGRAVGPVVAGVREVTEGQAIGELPLWITEINHVRPRGDVSASRLVRQTQDEAARAGIERIYWYAWSELISPQLLRLQAHTPAGRALLRSMSVNEMSVNEMSVSGG